MPGNDAFKVEGTVIEAFPNGTWQVELSNGHRLLAYVTGRSRLNADKILPGVKVRLQLSPYDLSEGRIIVETENKKI
jgi:translation initiation factor IF-1